MGHRYIDFAILDRDRIGGQIDIGGLAERLARAQAKARGVQRALHRAVILDIAIGHRSLAMGAHVGQRKDSPPTLNTDTAGSLSMRFASPDGRSATAPT
jgi:hypothetical protein